MDANEATTIVLSKIKGIDPDNATKIMGYLLIQDLSDKDLIRLAFGPEALLRSLIIKAKSQLGLLSSSSPAPSTPPSPSPLLSSMARPANPSSDNAQFMPSFSQRSNFEMGMSPRDPIWSGPISPSTSSSFPFSSRASFYPGNSSGSGGGSRNFMEEQQMDDFFPFLNDAGNSASDESHLHRRSFSESDACFGGSEDGALSGGAHRPCHYFARGFCKNGSGCKFVHADDFEGSISAFSGSPGSFDAAEQMLRLKIAHQGRAVTAAFAASQFVPGSSPISQRKYMNSLLQQHGDPHRLGMITGDEIYKHGQYQQERNDYMAMGMVDKSNSASRQIYLTFPADSTFKDEDVSEYFSTYGPVQDVRIPYQQKRMFGFVTFVYPETVKLILNKGNPHFICNSRVLVKPYKEKGKVPEKRQLHHHQQFERGDFSPSSNSSMLDSGEPFDYVGARLLNNTHEMMFRRRLEEQQAEFQQAIELQGRRLMNLQLPDLKNDGMYNHHHLRSFSVGSSAPIPIRANHNISNHRIFSPSEAISQVASEDNCAGAATASSTAAAASSEDQLQKEISAAGYHNSGSAARTDDSSIAEGVENKEKNSLEHILPDSPFASPTKSTGDHCSDFTKLADEISESSTKLVNDPEREVSPTMISSGNGPPQ